jgi:putative protein-disulfide isomerase
MKSFAAQAWANDQRIAALSGRQFSDAYRNKVLGAEDALLDSTVATLAVTAVADTAPERVIEVLSAIQTARYVDGKDVTSAAVVASLLEILGLVDASARVLTPDAALAEQLRDRTAKARDLMETYNMQGVPSLIAEVDGTRRGLDASTLYSGPDTVLTALGLA